MQNLIVYSSKIRSTDYILTVVLTVKNFSLMEFFKFINSYNNPLCELIKLKTMRQKPLKRLKINPLCFHSPDRRGCVKTAMQVSFPRKPVRGPALTGGNP